MTESFNWSAEQERRDAIAEVTALRRELKTETAAGAKAAQSDPRFIAAQQRLDATKSAVGMRTAAQDLQALNQIATSDVATAGQTPAQRKTERQALNQPSRQYFNQIKEALKDPNTVPGIKIPTQVTPEMIQEYAQSGADASKARFDWVWTQNQKAGKGGWGIGLVGVVQQKPTNPDKASKLDIFYSDSAPLVEARELKNEKSWNATWNNVSLDDLEQVLPEITFSEFQEVYYRLTLERDEDITIEDIVNKYNELYGEG